MSDKRDNAIGSFIGLAVGDALGTSVEFRKRGEFVPVTTMRGGGSFDMPIGGWTDDTSMAIALAKSLIHTHGQLNTHDLLTRFVNWWKTGRYSHNKMCFDIGGTTTLALQHFVKTGSPIKTGGKNQAGNGSIMRLCPAVIAHHNSIDDAISCAVEQGSTTHPNSECADICEELARILFFAINGYPKEQLIDVEYFNQLSENQVPSDGYVVSTMFAALWAISTTNNFRDAVLKAVNLGDDADTVGAVTGQIAGALYGFSTIPTEWFDVLLWNDRLYQMAEKLFEIGFDER